MFWAIQIESRYPDYLWVRLTVIANEDIGLADALALQLLETFRNQYQFLREKSASFSERLVLANAVLTLCDARKTRLADDFQCVIYRQTYFEGLHPEVPDYALDKHTSRGKRMGRDVAHWRTEGCRLANESEGLNAYADEAHRLREKYGALPKKQRGRSRNGKPNAAPESTRSDASLFPDEHS